MRKLYPLPILLSLLFALCLCGCGTDEEKTELKPTAEHATPFPGAENARFTLPTGNKK